MFEWIPILRGKYLTTEQYIMMLLILIYLILALIIKKYRIFIISMIPITFSQFGYANTLPLIIIISLNFIRKIQLFILFIIFICSQELCFAVHNIGLEFIVGFDEFAFSSSFTRLFVKINKNHIYITLSENPNQIFINLHSQNSNLELRSDMKQLDLYIYQTKDRYVHTFLMEINNENQKSFDIYFNNELIGSFQFEQLYDKNLSIVAGGDMGNTRISKQIWDQILNLENVDVIVIGGDIVYDNGMPTCYLCWDRFLNQYARINQKFNKIIPLILQVGNHDIGSEQNSQLLLDDRYFKKTPLYLVYFPQHTFQTNKVPKIHNRRGYFYHDFGKINLISLDSYYMHTPEEQQEFLHQHINNKSIISYHNPLVPLNKEQETDEFVKYLAQYFDPALLVMEHHKHNLKRSEPLKFIYQQYSIKVQRSDGGPIYIGNGAMGMINPKISIQDVLQQSLPEAHFWLMKVSNEILIEAINQNGKQVDSFKLHTSIF
ncbi:Serine/threonine-protein phosphatase cpped1 [Paramecium bursaria]